MINKIITFLTLLIISTLFPNQVLANNTSAFENKIFLGYYGRPNTKSLGVLGQNSINELIIKMKQTALEYTEADKTKKVVLSFHIIHDLATKEPGRDNDYLLNLRKKSLMKYIEAAQENNFAVIIDLQLGTKTPVEAIQPILKYLKFDNVHIAIDPEFKIPKHRRYAPGKYIGHIFGKDINEAQESISNYLLKNNIKGNRILMVHTFHPRMIRKIETIKNYRGVDLTLNIDGWGTPGAKVKLYNQLYTKEYSKIANSGFKLFLKNDIGTLMTARQVLGLDAVGSRKIKIPPTYINFQ